jgi:hypothetical protein
MGYMLNASFRWLGLRHEKKESAIADALLNIALLRID